MASLDQLTGGRALELETVWNEEWEKTLLERAVGRLKQRVNPHQFQMFDLYVLRRMPVTEVAQVLGTNVARIYLAKHRLSKLLRAEMVEAERGLGGASWLAPLMIGTNASGLHNSSLPGVRGSA